MEVDQVHDNQKSKKQKVHGTFQTVPTLWVITVSYYEPGIACCHTNDGGEMIEHHKVVLAMSQHEALAQASPNPWEINEHYCIDAKPYTLGSWITDD